MLLKNVILLFATAMLITTAYADDFYYCPKTISCNIIDATHYSCEGLPAGWITGALDMSNNPSTGLKTFTFSAAQSDVAVSGVKESDCVYGFNAGDSSYSISIVTNHYILPIKIGGTQWTRSAGRDYYCYSFHLYSVKPNDPLGCPFVENNTWP